MNFPYAVCKELDEMYELGMLSLAHLNRAKAEVEANWREYESMKVSDAASLVMELTNT